MQKFGTQIFNDGLRQVLRLKYQEFENLRSGETLSLLQKVRADSERFINAFINTFFAAIVGIAFLSGYSVTRYWMLVPVFLVGGLLMGGLTGLLSRQIKSLGLTFPGIRWRQAQTMKIFALEMKQIRRIQLLSFVQGSTLSLLKLAIFAPLQTLGNVIVGYREVETSLLNFDALMKKPVERQPESRVKIGPVTPVRFTDVSSCRKGKADNALESLPFLAGLGDTIAFVGPSGSGKSVLVKLLVGLYAPASRAF